MRDSWMYWGEAAEAQLGRYAQHWSEERRAELVRLAEFIAAADPHAQPIGVGAELGLPSVRIEHIEEAFKVHVAQQAPGGQ